MRCPNPRPGMTLIEILLVMAIMLAIAAIALPTMSAMYSDLQVKAAADEVRSVWTDCRTYSIEEGRAYRFAVQPDTGQYRIAPDSAEFWGGTASETAYGSEDASVPAHVQEGLLTGSILFKVPDGLGESSADGWTTIAVFLPDGTAAEDREIMLATEDDARPITVHVRAMTGAVSVRPAPIAEGR